MSDHEVAGEVGRPPSHYEGDGLQPFDIIDAFGLDFYEGSALKYLLRWRRKDGVVDLKKAIHYVQEIIERAERTQPLPDACPHCGGDHHPDHECSIEPKTYQPRY